MENFEENLRRKWGQEENMREEEETIEENE